MGQEDLAAAVLCEELVELVKILGSGLRGSVGWDHAQEAASRRFCFTWMFLSLPLSLKINK